MARWPQERGLPLVLALLTLLLAVLAVLQYRWTSAIGRADAERRGAELARSAHNFAASLERELGRIHQVFRLEPGPAPAERREVYLERLAAWRRGSDHPGIVASLVLASRAASGPPLLDTCDPQPPRCAAVDWPVDLEPLRPWLVSDGADRQGRDALLWRLPPVLDEPLSLLVPSVEMPNEVPSGARFGRFRLNGLVVVRLDAAALRDEVLPQLAESHFGPLERGEYTVAVVRSRDQAVVYSSDPGLGRDVVEHAELRLNLLDFPPGRPGPREGRFERGRAPRSREPFEPGRGNGERFDPWRPSPQREAPWLLVVRHRGGSLAEAVAAVRRRNLAVGFGVLALLGTAAAVLATGAQRARRLAQQQLEFVAGVTHELHTPLAAIRSAGQNLADGIVTEPERVRRYGDLVQKEAARLGALVAQVLDFAGIESGASTYTLEPLPLAPLVARVVADMALVLEESGMRVDTTVPEDLPPVRADAAALSRVLENLITNAVKFATEGGWIGVSARPGPGRATVVLHVEDRGPGMPPGEHARVFDPFYRGQVARERQSPGSGLGLSLVRHVVEAHGGRVQVEPRQGGGTRVVVELAT
jgi:signal transduction histidine kinase